MQLSDIIQRLYVDQVKFKKINDREISEEYCAIEVTKMHSYYYIEKGYERLSDFLKNGKDSPIFLKILITKYDDSYIEVQRIPHSITDIEKYQCQKN